MINEAFKIMEEKIVIAPEAIDLIWWEIIWNNQIVEI